MLATLDISVVLQSCIYEHAISKQYCRMKCCGRIRHAHTLRDHADQ